MAFSLPSSSSASSSSPLKWSYDVFLSFRGIDTRNTFTAFLYRALRDRGIKTYLDDRDLKRGETISPKLLKAIEESMISIIVLSPNYASSTWCLEELTKILECQKTKQQIVLPVFYHVDPSEVRNLRGDFGEALAKHQERFKEDSKVQRWKEALHEVAGLAGEHLEDGNEYEFMHKIIQWVDSTIDKSTYQLDIAEYPIGLDSRLTNLNTNLRIGRNDITLMIGIYGIGGIGKTTLAKAVFNSIGHQFEARCFLANVREISSREDGLVKLQEKLLYELLGNFGSFNIDGVGGFNVIKHRLCSKRVLIILDDVNELRQLKEIVGNHNWFGPGSRIVITTRDQHLLTYHQVDSMYEVQVLDHNQAIQLFSWHAFKREKPVESHVELTTCIIGYAKGLPLALTVLGSYLHGRSIQEWKSALEKYERSPHKNIYEILKISYDGLDDNEKDIFLDIACFFKGNSIEYVTKILDSCCFSSSIGIARLKDKCLININHYVEMHDLLQGMGKEIVRQESPKEVGKRSRLWFHEDIRRVLEENTGTNKIEGILLDFPRGHDKICLHPKAFKKMKNLRLFINWNAQFSGGPPNCLSNEIRVLDWPRYPWSFLPSNFCGNNLVEFRMLNGLFKELGSLKSKNLTTMDLYGCKFLTKTPDLSSCLNLMILKLNCCENLVEVHHSVGFLDNLSVFLVNGCCKLRIFPKRFKLRNLFEFGLNGCLSLEDFPEIECEMKFLHALNLEDTGIKELPSSIGNLSQLRKLHLNRCKNLVHLPSSIIQLRSLCFLALDGCPQQIKIGKVEEDDGTHESTPSVLHADKYEITSSVNWASLVLSLQFCCGLSESNFFTNANSFPNLVELHLSGSDIVIFPSVRFDGLRRLYLNNCKQLNEILPLPLSMEKVKARGCTSLESFAQLPELFFTSNGRNLSDLEIDLYGCPELLVNMRLPSLVERDSREQNGAYQFIRNMGIIYPGKTIPSWFSYCKEANDSNSCEIDINGTHYWDDAILLCVVFGFRVGINPEMEESVETTICVKVHDGWCWNVLYIQYIKLDCTESDHVCMRYTLLTCDRADTLRYRFECDSQLVVFRSVGAHFLNKHEENARDHKGVLHEDVGAHLDASHGEIESPVDLMDCKRRRDEYDCNLEPNWYPQQKRHSSTMGIRIIELENDDENPKEDMDLELI